MGTTKCQQMRERGMCSRLYMYVGEGLYVYVGEDLCMYVGEGLYMYVGECLLQKGIAR